MKQRTPERPTLDDVRLDDDGYPTSKNLDDAIRHLESVHRVVMAQRVDDRVIPFPTPPHWPVSPRPVG